MSRFLLHWSFSQWAPPVNLNKNKLALARGLSVLQKPCTRASARYQGLPTTMPFNQPGNYANASFGTYYDVAGNLTYNYHTDGVIQSSSRFTVRSPIDISDYLPQDSKLFPYIVAKEFGGSHWRYLSSGGCCYDVFGESIDDYHYRIISLWYW